MRRRLQQLCPAELQLSTRSEVHSCCSFLERQIHERIGSPHGAWLLELHDPMQIIYSLGQQCGILCSMLKQADDMLLAAALYCEARPGVWLLQEGNQPLLHKPPRFSISTAACSLHRVCLPVLLLPHLVVHYHRKCCLSVVQLTSLQRCE